MDVATQRIVTICLGPLDSNLRFTIMVNRDGWEFPFRARIKQVRGDESVSPDLHLPEHIFHWKIHDRAQAIS